MLVRHPMAWRRRASVRVAGPARLAARRRCSPRASRIASADLWVGDHSDSLSRDAEASRRRHARETIRVCRNLGMSWSRSGRRRGVGGLPAPGRRCRARLRPLSFRRACLPAAPARRHPPTHNRPRHRRRRPASASSMPTAPTRAAPSRRACTSAHALAHAWPRREGAASHQFGSEGVDHLRDRLVRGDRVLERRDDPARHRGPGGCARSGSPSPQRRPGNGLSGHDRASVGLGVRPAVADALDGHALGMRCTR